MNHVFLETGCLALISVSGVLQLCLTWQSGAVAADRNVSMINFVFVHFFPAHERRDSKLSKQTAPGGLFVPYVCVCVCVCMC